MNRITRCFFNVNMSLQHDGLYAVAKSAKVLLDDLKAGEHVVFINRARNRLKLYSANNVVSYLRLKNGERLRLESIALIPQCFKADGSVDYRAALKRSLLEGLARTRE